MNFIDNTHLTDACAKNNEIIWNAISGSARGATHVIKNLPNQDYCRNESYSIADSNSILISAVSDGHGSSKAIRSDVGAKIAVDTGIELSKKLFEEIYRLPQGQQNIKRLIQERLPREITRIWQERVFQHASTVPFSEKERNKYLESYGCDAPVEFNTPSELPLYVYGATLTIAHVSNSFVSYLKIGDGDIIEVRDVNGELLCTYPFPKTIDDLGDDVDSLCQENAINNFEIYYQPFDQTIPALIMLSTDGYSNSYVNDTDFQKSALDYLNYLRTNSRVDISNSLPEWLNEISQGGSGDDISVILIKREEVNDIDRIRKSVQKITSQQEKTSNKFIEIDEEVNSNFLKIKELQEESQKKEKQYKNAIRRIILSNKKLNNNINKLNKEVFDVSSQITEISYQVRKQSILNLILVTSLSLLIYQSLKFDILFL